MAGLECAWAHQEEQLGTGHALLQAMPYLTDVDRILVLYGDIPLIRSSTLLGLMAEAADTHLGVLTAILTEPSGYGRILRDHHGQVRRIVEDREASAAELAIDEINTGFMVASRAPLVQWLSSLGNANAKGEYYLTDIVALADAEDHVDTQNPLPGVVDQPVLLDLAIGQHHGLVVAAQDDRGEGLDFEHRARRAVRLDCLANDKGRKEQEVYRGGQIAQRLL